MSEELKCCICDDTIKADPITGWAGGNNAEPVKDGRCCDDCNWSVVFPKRIIGLYQAEEMNYPNDKKNQFKK
tara:strand:- start:246 stop:461 length:216 start_codon:yes stop_codon:yes gene_type:complete